MSQGDSIHLLTIPILCVILLTTQRLQFPIEGDPSTFFTPAPNFLNSILLPLLSTKFNLQGKKNAIVITFGTLFTPLCCWVCSSSFWSVLSLPYGREVLYKYGGSSHVSLWQQHQHCQGACWKCKILAPPKNTELETLETRWSLAV